MAKVEQIVIEITSTAGIESLFFIIIQFLESRNGKHQRGVKITDRKHVFEKTDTAFTKIGIVLYGTHKPLGSRSAWP